MPRCDRAGCVYLAFWRPVLVLHLVPPTVAVLPGAELDRRYATPARAKLQQYICGKHRSTLTAHELITQQGWDDLCAGLRRAGIPVPKREWLQIEWERIGVEAAP